jgi:LPS export ABC transporter protein LptC
MLVVVVGALIGIGYQVWRSAAATRKKSGRELRIEIPAGVAQHIRDFRRVKMKHGRPVWEIQAAEAQYFEDANEITVRDPRLVFYFDDGGRRASLAGNEGRLHLDQQELESVTVRGAVRVSLDDVDLETDEATYERARDLITAPGAVTVRGRTVDVRARGMEVEITPQHVRLLADVHTVLRLDEADS